MRATGGCRRRLAEGVPCTPYHHILVRVPPTSTVARTPQYGPGGAVRSLRKRPDKVPPEAGHLATAGGEDGRKVDFKRNEPLWSRRALAWPTGEQYFRLAIQLALIVVVSRILPAEIGISIIGTGIMAIALGMREFATSDFLIQRPEVTRDDGSGIAFLPVLVIMMLVLARFRTFYGGKLALSPTRRRRGTDRGTVSFPGIVRPRRPSGARVHQHDSVAITCLVCLLAFSGSAARLRVGNGGSGRHHHRPVLLLSTGSADFRPSLNSWRSVLAFGGYNGVSFVINLAYEALPQLVLGRILPYSAVALAQSGADGVRHPEPGHPGECLLGGVSRPGSRGPRSGEGALPASAWPDPGSSGREKCSPYWPTRSSQLHTGDGGSAPSLCSRSWPSRASHGFGDADLAGPSGRGRQLRDRVARMSSDGRCPRSYCAPRPGLASWRWRRAKLVTVPFQMVLSLCFAAAKSPSGGARSG